jgi:hypothetical protein
MMAADVVYDLCKLTPAEITLDIVGSAIEGGRSLSGVTQSIDYSGGGFVAVTYGGIIPRDASQAKEWNRLAAALNGSVRTVRLPLWADYVAARNAAGLPAGGPGGPANPTVANDHVVGATVIDLNVPAGVTISGGEWFSIDHGGVIIHRAYRIWKVTAGTPLVINFMPPLREGVTTGQVTNFWRPQCLMRLPAGETMAWQFRVPGVTSELSVNFVEAFS